jgi:hypothetical protein
MRNKKLALVWLIVAVICLALGLLGTAFNGILLAAAVLFAILAYASNRPALPVNPITGEPRDENKGVDSPERQSEIG